MSETLSSLPQTRDLRAHGARLLCCLALAAWPGCAAPGQQPDGSESGVTTVDAAPVQAPPRNLQQISREEYLARLARLQAVVSACAQRVEACDEASPGQDVLVDHGSFEADWSWLRDVLRKAQDGKGAGRESLLNAAAERLGEEAADAERSDTAGQQRLQTQARGKADEILAHREFRRVQENSWWAQKTAAFFLFLDKLFAGVGALLPRSPWFGTLLAWGVLAMAAGGLLLWVWRTSRQQRMVITAGRNSSGALWQEESEDWAERANAEALRGDWREAVHCLYWSAIVMLEGQKLWRQNRARTPREYLVLLDPASDRHRDLRGLTGVFEGIWYGLRPASESDYAQAHTLLERLRAG